MGAYKFYNPTTQQWEIIKSKSIIKDDGSLEYTPDDIKGIDDKIGVLNGVGEIQEKANKSDLTTLQQEVTSHKTESMPHKFVDGIKNYRYGFSVVDGIVMFNYEEVVE